MIKKTADFPLFINGVSIVSGETNIFPAPAAYDITETTNSNYTRTFSGDCDTDGHIDLSPGDNKFCVITNNDIAPSPRRSSGGSYTYIPPVPPLIAVVKVPNPLALPAGPGLVTYTYALRNIGTVPATDITMVGDTCSPIILTSGDTNNDLKLDVSETWTYHCAITLLATHTNTVVATGWANGINAIDYASATVIVGVPIVPPLIHVTKIPNPLALLAGGNIVTYTYTVTNPGTVPLSNVNIADDKCTGLPSRILGHPGDLNKNNLLEKNEVWNFTCQTSLTETTTNTGTASGEANGLIAKDFAIATVIVATAAPTLPSTGFAPSTGRIYWNIIMLSGILILISISFIAILKKNKI